MDGPNRKTSLLSNIEITLISQNWTLKCGFWLVTGAISWKWINRPNDIFCMLQKLNSMINASRHNSHKSQLFHCVTKKRFTKEIYIFCSTFWMGLEIDIFPTVFHKASAFAVPRLLGRTGYGIRAKCWRRSTSLESAPTMWVQSIFEIEFLWQSKVVIIVLMLRNHNERP